MRQPYSFLDDPSVPDFDWRAPLAVMDGDCALCAFGARMIDRLDHAKEIRIATIETALGRALLAHYGLRATAPDSWLFIEDGVAHDGFDAMIRLGRRTGGIGHALRLLQVLPRPLRSGLYSWIARNRYRLFGRRRMCDLPSDSLRARLVG
ncbi:thiol-disulfide oxidoreductase DCC family protein [Cognatishimia sp. MH4019]|uniref:thiol-disulfide oxidoreductase DCC family protein n=1 Tax=Cognatishimia sp. MH4019 TaxID=2854030 RepID=UPI001CD6A1BD|nr:DCC1-like thiol-disulfide oxidoreductase family protein [Cognatishimia sp. MH4019]